jgi:hypothetical protein
MTALEFRKHFFENIVVSKLGYNPRIEIKPAHLANGLFRAICGGYVNDEAQQMAIYPKAYPFLTTESPLIEGKLASRIERFTPHQREALRFLNGQEEKRAMMNSLLGADKTLFRLVNTSSYSLSHVSQITNDNHDRNTGLWLFSILKQGDNNPALKLLRDLLLQDSLNRNDELSLITLPLTSDSILHTQNYDYAEPENIKNNTGGVFNDQIIQTIRAAFDLLALNDTESAHKNGKLDVLRHFVILGCFSVYFHLANADKNIPTVPMIFRFDRNLTTLSQASVRSYQYLLRSINELLYREIYNVLELLDHNGSYSSWNDDESIEKHIRETIDWYRTTTPSSREKEKNTVDKLQQECLVLFQSYRSETASTHPREALARAISDMLAIVLSSTPQDVVRGLGTRIGLLSQYSGHQRKTYDPHPDFLEVLVRASIPPGQIWTLPKLAQHWADSFGIFCGALGDENNRIQSLGVSVDQGEWLTNTNALAEMLELSGYARRYADGVVLVSVDR